MNYFYVKYKQKMKKEEFFYNSDKKMCKKREKGGNEGIQLLSTEEEFNAFCASKCLQLSRSTRKEGGKLNLINLNNKKRILHFIYKVEKLNFCFVSCNF